MLERALPLLLLLGCPAVVVGQSSSILPRPAAPPVQASPTPVLAEKQQQSLEELQRLIASRDALTKEIQRLSRITGQDQQVIASVKVCELSLNKARNAIINVEGVESKWWQANGFGGALAAGAFDNPGQAQNAMQIKSGSETVQTGVIENDELLQKTVAELEKAGALKVLADPTLATVSGRPVSLHVGGEFPISVPQTNGDSTIEFKKFGTQLDLVPVVLGHGRIRLDLRPCISDIDADRSVVLGDLTAPGLRVRMVDVGVEMSSGQTFVLAGLVQQRVVHKAHEEPGKAENDKNSGLVPRKTSEGKSDPGQNEIEATELIVMVRAHLVQIGQRPAF